MVRLLVALALPCAVGLPFTLWLDRWPVRLAASFLCGIVAITAGLISVGVLGLGYGAAGLAALGVVWAVAAGFTLLRTRPAVAFAVSWPRAPWPAWLMAALTALNVASAAGYAFKTPIADTDVVQFWLPKAVALGTSGFYALAHSVYPDYPPLWPMHLLIAGAGGTWIKLLPTAYLVATLVLVFDFVRRRAGPTIGATSAFAVSAVPYVWLPYGVNDLMSQVPTMAFVLGSTVMLAEYVDRPHAARAALAAIFAIGATWTRPEGFLHAFVVMALLAIVAVRSRRWREVVLPATGVVLAFVAWRFIVRYQFDYAGGLQLDFSALTPAALLSSLRDTTLYAATNLGNPYLFGPFLIATALIALGARFFRSFWVVATVLFANLVIIVATEAWIPTTSVGEPLIWWLTTGFKRLVMDVIPLLYICAALATAGLLREGLAQRRRSAASVAAVAAAIAVIAVAAYAEYRVGGPTSYDLSDMGPAHVSGSSATVEYPAPGVMSITTTGDTETITYYLLSTGRRLPPLDNITGTFTRFTSSVSASGGGGSEHFVLSADGRQLAQTTASPGQGTVGLDADVPAGTRLLDLSVQPAQSTAETATWTHPTLERFTVWWVVEVLLLLAVAAMTAAVLTSRVGLAGAAVAILLGAAAIQQLEATAAIALPGWLYAARLLHLG
jgi:hypothetical protein